MNKILSKALLVLFHFVVAIAVFVSLVSFFVAGEDYFMIGILSAMLAIVLMAGLENFTEKKVNFIAIILFLPIVFIINLALLPIGNGAPLAAHDATIRVYLEQIQKNFKDYYSEKSSYIGVENDPDYMILRDKILEKQNSKKVKDPYFVQFRDQEYCIKVQLLGKDNYFWCIDSKGNNIEPTNQYCTPEKPYCAE